MINAFRFKADTSQIITYRCSETFMWGRRMRARLSDSGAAEDRKPQPGTRQSPGYTSLPDECGSKCNSKGICGEGSACLCRLLCSTIHLRPVTPCQLMQTFLGVRGDKPQSYTSLVFLVPSHKSWRGGALLRARLSARPLWWAAV